MLHAMKEGCEGSEPAKKRSIELPVISAEKPRSRMGRWRAGALIALNLLMVAHIVQWWIMGRTVSPIEPSEAMFTLQRGAVNAGVIFFSLAILATLIFGRFVCGWGCHVVALQDLCGWIMKKIGITPKPFRSRLLIFVPLLAALYMFVWPTIARSLTKPPSEPLIPDFTNHIVTTEFWATFPPVWLAIPFLFICGFMTVYFLGAKGFCTYGCPYGGFFALADKVAPGKIKVTDACNQCGHCTAVCTSNVLVHSEVKQFGMVVDPGCMKCMDCVSACPNDALYFGFAKPAASIGKVTKKSASLSWPEEIAAALVFAASLIAVWNVYQLIPMLMALGIAGVSTFVAMCSYKVIATKSASFHKFVLRSQNGITRTGWAFLAFSVIWLGVVAHSGVVRYFERHGNIAFESLTIPDELALAGSDPAQWLSPEARSQTAAGLRSFDTARSIGLLTNVDALPKHAWLEYLLGNSDRALELLDNAAERQSGRARAISHYYRGAILNRVGRSAEAVRSLDQAMIEAPDLVLAREEKGEGLWTLGRKQEAIAVWSDAIRGSAGLPLTNYFLAGANADLGRQDAASAYEAQADRLAPADPYFQWMLGLRLRGAGMNELAEKRFGRAIQLDPAFASRRK